MTWKLPGSGTRESSTVTSACLPSENWRNEGIGPPEMEQGVEFDRPTSPLIPGPREQTQAQFDDRRIQGVEGGRQIQSEILGRVEFPAPPINPWVKSP